MSVVNWELWATVRLWVGGSRVLNYTLVSDWPPGSRDPGPGLWLVGAICSWLAHCRCKSSDLWTPAPGLVTAGTQGAAALRSQYFTKIKMIIIHYPKHVYKGKPKQWFAVYQEIESGHARLSLFSRDEVLMRNSQDIRPWHWEGEVREETGRNFPTAGPRDPAVIRFVIHKH